MQLTLHLTSLVILFGVTSTLVFAALLWIVPWGNRRANQCLGLLMLVSSLLSIAYVPRIEVDALPAEFQWAFSLQLTFGPLLYFYTCFLTRADFHWRWAHAWHLVPALISAGVWYLQLPLSPEGWLNQPCPAGGECDLVQRSRFVHRAATIVSLLAYTITALRLLRPHLQRVKEHYSSLEEVDLRWLSVMLSVLLGTVLLGTAVEIYGWFTPPKSLTPGLLQAMWPLILSLLLGWFGLQQRRLQVVEKGSAVEEPADSADRKYQTSSLTESGSQGIWEQLQAVMAADKPYLESDLKIADLATLLDVRVHHLSETINRFAQSSFYEYINQHRAEEAARLLLDNSMRHFSVTDIGQQAGFNSNSTFFSHFKKRLQQTPRQYRKSADIS